MGAGKLYDDGLTTPRLPGREKAAAGGEPAPTPLPPAAAPPEAAGSLSPAMIRELNVTRLRQKYPRWRVWADDEGYHCRRRGSFRHDLGPGAAAHSLHNRDYRVFRVHLAVEDELEIPEGDWSP